MCAQELGPCRADLMDGRPCGELLRLVVDHLRVLLEDLVPAAARRVQDEGYRELLLVMADLPYLAADDVAALIEAGRQSAVVIAEAKDGGTNALLLRPPTVLAFAFATGQPSASRHAHQARAAGIEPVIVRRPGLARDIDTPADLAALASDHPAYRVYRHVA